MDQKVQTNEEVVMGDAVSLSIILGGKIIKKEREVNFIVHLPAFGDFEVVKSEGAWWNDAAKVNKLFTAYSSGATDEMACVQANISLWQLRYFREQHPQFSRAKKAVKMLFVTAYVNGLTTMGPQDLPTIRWVLGKRHPDFQGVVEPEDGDEVLQPTMPSINATNVQINVNNKEVDNTLREIARLFAAGDEGEGEIDDIVAGAKKRMAKQGS